ncbi:N-acetylmuramoyl-L-alanine amidase [Synechococcus sp. PCC 7336]|uniref:N-acetylmuramoyl-L-alanine amidase n=1 Tax=Synechococcus sp. PCC 7336 TaxID=195250 RepID=UPI00037277C6|nr:peptidoglycan recognition family protein [Synechococcus sp. PCC 7336]
MSWILETRTSMYLMEEDKFISKIDFKSTNPSGKDKLIVVDLQDWFRRIDSLGTLVRDLGRTDEPELLAEDHPGTGSDFFSKPPTQIKRTRKQSNRRTGVDIDTIVLHYTASNNDASGLFTLTDGDREASSHYLVFKNGTIYEIVPEDKKAWHAPSVNSRSIGIEHTAGVGERFTEEQEAASIKLVSYLLAKYDLPYTAVTAHKWTPQATLCPGNLFGSNGTLEEFMAWRERNFATLFPSDGSADRIMTA